MRNVNKLNLFSFLVLVSLCLGINSVSGVIKEQREIASGARLENNSSKTQGESVITTAITVGDEKFDDNELKKLSVQNFTLDEKKSGILNKDKSQKIMRKLREIIVENNKASDANECLTCFANGTSALDEECYYGGSIVPRQRCRNLQKCFTEIHHSYLKRGCIIPGNEKRTFVCKCNLCNDKPPNISTYYNYLTLDDWEYDNSRLQKSSKMDLLCKTCESFTVNKAANNICKIGTNADSMVCGPDQLCFTRFDGETENVSRGCMQKPAFNSIYYICNTTRCNNENFHNLRVKRDSGDLFSFLKDSRLKSLRSSHNNIKFQYIWALNLIVCLWVIL